VRRRKRIHGHGNHERWLVSYADFITLLFAFFVVLYASAQVDQRKVGRLALAIQVAFQDLGVFPDSTTQIPVNTNEPMPFNTVQAIENAKHSAELGRIAPSPNGAIDAVSEEPDFSGLQNELQKALQHEINLRSIALHREVEGLVISLREFGFFDSGSAHLKLSALPALDRIAVILSVRKCEIRIEGHTDNIPIHTAQMASNWELSTARSTELVRLLLQHYHFAPERLSAAGYAEYHPIADNSTVQGRAQNRRVDIVILSKQLPLRNSRTTVNHNQIEANQSKADHNNSAQNASSQNKPSPVIP
jgi:chemotaxis protein MotB